MKDKCPLISIITVCLNSECTLERAFNSILNQSCRNMEYIIVDGVSTDRTLNIVTEYQKRFDSNNIRFKWITELDSGIYDAMNKGIAMSSGQIIGILNSDDYYETNTIELIANAFHTHPEIGIFYGFLRFIQGDLELQTYRYRYENYLLNKQMQVFSATQHPTCFVKREVYHQIGHFDTQFRTAADYDFLIRAMKAGIQFQALDAVLCNFCTGGVSHTMSSFERLVQRYGVLTKNDMLTEEEARAMRKQLRFRRYKCLKSNVAKKLFRL